MSNSKHLRSLIRQVMETKALTYQAVADQATAHGFKLSRSTVHDLATEPIMSRPPTFEQISALACGLGIDPDEVKRAVLADIGMLDISDSADVRMMAALTENLSEQDRQQALRILAEVVKGMGH